MGWMYYQQIPTVWHGFRLEMPLKFADREHDTIAIEFLGLDKEMSQNSPNTDGYVLEYCKLRKNHVWSRFSCRWNHRWLSIGSNTQFVDVCRCIGSCMLPQQLVSCGWIWLGELTCFSHDPHVCCCFLCCLLPPLFAVAQSPRLRSPASRISSRLHSYPTASKGLSRNKTKRNMMGYLYHGIHHTI